MDTKEAFVRQEQLANGLRVFIRQMPYVNSVTTLLLFNAGSRRETKKTSGIGHLTEHLVNEGSHSYPSPEHVDKATAIRGGSNNAETDREYSAFSTKLPKEHRNFGIKFLREIAFNPRFQKSAFQKEVKIIIEEIGQDKDNLDERQWFLLLNAVWAGHPLSQNIFGTEESVSTLTRQDVINYHNKFYVPNNASLIVVGNVDYHRTLDQIAAHYEKLKPKPIDLNKTKPVFSQPRSRIFVEQRDLEQIRIMIGISTGIGLSVPEFNQVEVLAEVLSSKMLYKLVYDLNIAYSAGALNYEVSDAGVIATYANVNPKNVRRAIREMSHLLRTAKITKEDVRVARKPIIGTFDTGLETTESVAKFIGDQVITTGTVVSIETAKKAYATITPHSLCRLRDTLLTSHNHVLTLMGKISDHEAAALESLSF